ncbi:MAG TPA: AraC family transcriptional regulator, partial [Rhodanobacteraceae bacterium]
LRFERVREGADAKPTEPFVHFHDVHELVLFGEVAGHFDVDGCRYALSSGSIAFIPSMRQHDFSLLGGSRDWVLVQFEAAVGETLSRAPGLERLREPFCARPNAALRERLGFLAEWLVGLRSNDPLARPVAELLLHAAATAPRIGGTKLATDVHGLNRLRPAIDSLRRDPAHAPGAEQAAALCALSPAYFSRRFKQQVGMSWSDYVRTHRLHLASRRLLESDVGAAVIAGNLGFATPSHFGELFRQRFGMAPSAYRRAGRNRTQDSTDK